MTTATPQSTVLHTGITMSAETNARTLFGELLGLPVTREFEVREEIVATLFERHGKAKVLVFDGGAVAVEVFICPGCGGPSRWYDHLCLAVENREALLERAASHGLRVNRFTTNEKEIVVLKDWDGNLYEIKEAG